MESKYYAYNEKSAGYRRIISALSALDKKRELP